MRYGECVQEIVQEGPGGAEPRLEGSVLDGDNAFFVGERFADHA